MAMRCLPFACTDVKKISRSASKVLDIKILEFSSRLMFGFRIYVFVGYAIRYDLIYNITVVYRSSRLDQLEESDWINCRDPSPA